MIIIEETGPLALLQDLGRPGLAKLGVSPSGAADRGAHRLANRLVGNPEGAATIETTLGGLTISTDALTWIAVTGCPTQLTHNAEPTASQATLLLHPGDRVRIEPPPQGLRNYLAVRGGFDVAPTLNSRATDVLSGLGPAPLVSGQQLPTGHPTEPLPNTTFAIGPAPNPQLEIRPGPRTDWFTADAIRALTESAWQVSTDCNRVAVRLEGPRLERQVTAELPSEGLIRGAIQVPASGQPLIFLPDHPVTGGYPVLAVLTPAAADHAAQLRPGETIRFFWL